MAPDSTVERADTVGPSPRQRGRGPGSLTRRRPSHDGRSRRSPTDRWGPAATSRSPGRSQVNVVARPVYCRRRVRGSTEHSHQFLTVICVSSVYISVVRRFTGRKGGRHRHRPGGERLTPVGYDGGTSRALRGPTFGNHDRTDRPGLGVLLHRAAAVTCPSRLPTCHEDSLRSRGTRG
jgi:hypothetical protein